MSIDLSPEALAKIRDEFCNPKSYIDGIVNGLCDALEETRDERDEARRQRDDVLDELDEARSDYERMKHQVYASAAINGPPTSPEDKFKSLTLSSETTGEDKHEKGNSTLGPDAWNEYISG